MYKSLYFQCRFHCDGYQLYYISVGETINLMAIDTQRFVDLTGNISQIWSSPLMIILCQYFLWQYLGPSSLAGLLLMVITIPVDTIIAKKLKKLQIANMKNKDERIKIMNEILDGVKIVKLYAWEPSFVQKVVEIRDKELHTFRWIAYLQAILTFIFSATPFLGKKLLIDFVYTMYILIFSFYYINLP